MEESQKHEFDLLSYRILESQGLGTVNCFRCVLCTTSGSLNGEITACARLHLPCLSSLVFFFCFFSSFIPLHRGCHFFGTSQDCLFHSQAAGASYWPPGDQARRGRERRRWFNSHVALSAWHRRRQSK